jgi:hypothetical protein
VAATNNARSRQTLKYVPFFVKTINFVKNYHSFSHSGQCVLPYCHFSSNTDSAVAGPARRNEMPDRQQRAPRKRPSREEIVQKKPKLPGRRNPGQPRSKQKIFLERRDPKDDKGCVGLRNQSRAAKINGLSGRRATSA